MRAEEIEVLIDKHLERKPEVPWCFLDGEAALEAKRWGATLSHLRQWADTQERIDRAVAILAAAPDLMKDDFSRNEVKKLVTALSCVYAELTAGETPDGRHRKPIGPEPA